MPETMALTTIPSPWVTFLWVSSNVDGHPCTHHYQHTQLVEKGLGGSEGGVDEEGVHPREDSKQPKGEEGGSTCWLVSGSLEDGPPAQSHHSDGEEEVEREINPENKVRTFVEVINDGGGGGGEKEGDGRVV